MENQLLKQKKYPHSRTRETQEQYRRLRDSLDKTKEFTPNAPEAFLFPLKNRFVRLYIIVLLITMLLCIAAFAGLSPSGQ